ncbi:MAG: DUF1430 domain-containing protein [Firmicutes bacterium]|nr:DUF1430 domain-containing protein [Bacillota bacterium]
MRKILLSLFIINILLSFFVFYDMQNNSLNDKIFKSGEEQSITIKIEKEINERNRVSTIDTIQKVAEEYDADIIYKVYNNPPGQTLNLIKYVYMKDSNKVFGNIRITGKGLGDYDKSNNYLSSKNTEDKSMVGKILVLNPDISFKIATFENLKSEKYVLSGYYSVNVEKAKFDSFLNDLKSNLGVEVSRESGFHNTRVVIPPILKIIPMIIVFLLSILVVVYDLISRFKDLGVKKLNGYSVRRLKWEYVRGIGLVFLIGVIISYIIIGLLYFKFSSLLYMELVFKSFIYTSILFLVVLLILLIPLSYINRITISSAIKNMKPVHIVKRLSGGFKIVFTGILIGLFIFALKLYVPVYNFYFENVKKWEDTINYAQVSLSYDNQNPTFEDMIWEMVQNKKLYVYANEQGGIQFKVDEDSKSEAIDPKLRELENIIYRSININNNYLKKYPIYDINNKKVVVNDSENINYILVPEKYASYADDIKYSFENNWYSIHDMPIQFKEGRLKEQKAGFEAAPEYFDKEFGKLEIIIIRNGQEYFTYDLSISPETNNMVKDRVVVVNTNKASMIYDISNNGGYFIKTDNPEEPFISISDKVAELGLSAYYFQAYSIYGSVAGQVNFYLDALSQIAVIFGIAGITIGILIAYSIMIYMEKEKMELSIKMLNGYSFMARHGKKLLNTMLLYIIYLPAFYFVHWNKTEMIALTILLICILLLDLITSYIFIRIYERKNIKDILKGN